MACRLSLNLPSRGVAALALCAASAASWAQAPAASAAGASKSPWVVGPVAPPPAAEPPPSPMVIGPAEPSAAAASAPRPAELSVTEWLQRMHEASRQRNYVGTFVVSSSSGALSAARIWHACDTRQQVERVDVLTGAPRTMIRRDDEVLTFLPQARTVRSDKRGSLGVFPDLLKSSDSAIADFYVARRVGADRVAGFDADVVHLAARDRLRFGYRVWSERKSGLIVKLQTLDPAGGVLEQAAFSELRIDAPLKVEKLAQMMAVPEGWQLQKSEAVKVDPAAEGWAMKSPVPGFRPVNCYKRPAEGVVQWIFTDGLASVSLFLEQYQRERHTQEGVYASGATHSLTRRVQDWWLTAVGEVPPQTLKAFALNLERRK